MPGQKLPRGVYYEAKKRRYRVRLYRNNSTFMGGYFPTELLALAAWTKLRRVITDIPKLRRNQQEDRVIHRPTIAGIFATIKDDLIRSPGSKRVAKK